MIKRGIVFIFLLSFLFPLLLSCSNEKAGSSVQHVYEENVENNAVQVAGIKIASNYIELVKEAGVDLQYNISAVVQPDNAENKTLLYTSSNPEVAEVSSDGYVTIKDFGVFNVKIQSDANKEIWQQISFYVRENIMTKIDMENNPLSFFGSYSILQYGIDKEPDTNVGGSFSVNMDRTAQNAVTMELLFNGLDLPVTAVLDDLSSVSYEEAALSIFTYLKGTVKTDSSVIIQLKADEHTSLIEQGILQAGQILYLSIKKEYDLVPGQSHVEEIPVSVTDIQVNDVQKLDRLVNATYTLNPVVLPVNASNKAVTYSTSNDKVASVSPTGVVTALNEGSAEIMITSVSNGEVVGTTTVNVVDSTVRVKDVVFEQIDSDIYVGTPVTVKATVQPANATYKDITYYSKNPSIATINSATGVVTPRRKGTVEIVAVTDKGSFEKTLTLNVNVYSFPVTAITNIPSEINMAVANQITIKPEVFPSYADDTSLIYTADDSGNVSVDANGVITANKTGQGIVTVASAKYPEIKKDITVNVRQEQEEIYITSINLNNAPADLYINHTEYLMTPTYEPANANVDTEISVQADNNSLVMIMPLDNGSYSILPQAEGRVTVTVKSKNGVSKDVSFNIKKVMNVKGYYTINKVEYTLADKTETFTPENDKLQGEFAIDLLDDKYTIKGRLQYTPANPLVSYTFNNWRYIYENKEIMLDTLDKYASQTKDALAAQNIKVTGDYTLEYTYTQDSFKAVIYLTKVNNETKDILDRTIYLTPVNMAADPHSAEGYYEMTWFYGNSVNNKWLERYPAIYSSSQDDMPTYSDIGITYHKDCPNIGGWAACYGGGGGENGSVTNYSGAFAVKIDGTNENAQISSIMKVQIQGHQNFNLQTWLKYMHTSFDPLTISQVTSHSGKIVDKTLKAKIISNSGDKGYKGAFLAYNQLPDNIMQFEMQYLSDYKFMYRAKKVSDRYIDLPTAKYVDGDVSGRTPPAVPDLAKIVPVEDFTGAVSAIE